MRNKILFGIVVLFVTTFFFSGCANEKEFENESLVSQKEDQREVKDISNEKSVLSDMETYKNDSYGLSFDYPSTYKKATDKDLKAGEISNLRMTDDSKEGTFEFACHGTPDGRGGPQPTDILYSTKIEENKLVVTNRREIEKNIGNDDNKTTIEFSIGDLYCDGKYDTHPGNEEGNGYINVLSPTNANGILCFASYTEGDHEDEIKSIIDSVELSKPEIFGKR